MAAAADDGTVMRRPPLKAYAVSSAGALTVETYQSDAGEMLARPCRHRITLNRTSHRRYAYRIGGNGRTERIARPRDTLGFEPADTWLWVDGDAGDYVSIFQDVAVYRRLQDELDRKVDLRDRSFFAPVDPATLSVINALGGLAGGVPDMLLTEQLGLSLASCVLRLADAYLGRANPISCKLSTWRLAQVLACIDERLTDNALALGDLAAVAGLSPFHFTRSFKATTGTSPHRFIVERRLELAKTLIRSGRYGLAEVAQAAGFADQPHLSSVFRRAFGVTPGEFRRNE